MADPVQPTQPTPAPVTTPPVPAAPPATVAPAATPPNPTEPATAPPTETSKDKAEHDAKEWLKLSYPDYLLEEPAKPNPQPLDLEKDKKPVQPATPPVAQESTPAPAPVPASTATPTPPAEPVKVTKRKPLPEIEEIVKQTVAATVKAIAPPVPPTAPQPTPQKPTAPAVPADDLSTWTTEEIRLLHTATYAEQVQPEKFKGLVDGIKADKKKIDDYRTKAIQEDPDWDETRDNKFGSLLESIKPRLNHIEMTDLEDERMSVEAEKRVATKFESKFEEQAKQLREIQTKPIVEHHVGNFAHGLTQLIANKYEGKSETVAALAADLIEHGQEKVMEKYPHVAPIALQTVQTAVSLATEFTRLDMGLDKPDPQNKRHQWLNNLMMRHDQMMANQPTEKRSKAIDGLNRTFVTRPEYSRIAKEHPEQLGAYWTHETQDYLAAIGASADWELNQKIRQFEESMAKAGYKRESLKATEQPKPTSQPIPPEMKPTLPSSSPSPGPGAGGSLKTGQGALDEDMMKLLGYK